MNITVKCCPSDFAIGTSKNGTYLSFFDGSVGANVVIEMKKLPLLFSVIEHGVKNLHKEESLIELQACSATDKESGNAR